MTLTHLDLDRIEGLAGRLRESKAEVLRLLAKDAGSLKAASVISGWIWDTDSALADLTALITRIRELEGALGDAGRELDEAADKFWVIHCNHPGQACGRAQEEDKQFCETMHHRMRAARDRARTALQRKTP